MLLLSEAATKEINLHTGRHICKQCWLSPNSHDLLPSLPGNYEILHLNSFFAELPNDVTGRCQIFRNIEVMSSCLPNATTLISFSTQARYLFIFKSFSKLLNSIFCEVYLSAQRSKCCFIALNYDEKQPGGEILNLLFMQLATNQFHFNTISLKIPVKYPLCVHFRYTEDSQRALNDPLHIFDTFLVVHQTT